MSGNDALLYRARRVHSELVDGSKAVAPRVREVYQLDHRIGFTGQLVAVNLRFEEERLNEFTGFEQCAARLAQDLIAQIIQLAVSQPGPTIVSAIDASNGVPEDIRQNPLPEIQAQTARGMARHDPAALIHNLPA